MALPFFRTSSLALLLTACCFSSELREPITFTSENGSLNLLMIAKAAPVPTLPHAPTGWVYEICTRPVDTSESCPAQNGKPNFYGGTLLKLTAGDTLRIHLVNELPPVYDSEHAKEPNFEFLELNPTNIHTHGMLVAPRRPSKENPTYGDNILVLTFNSRNGKPEMSPHMHSDIRYDSTDYEIKVPASHPSGLFWFHPHTHGISLNQISAGLGGIITVGDINDYICKNRSCSTLVSQAKVRHMIVKDAQLLPDGKIQTQEDPDFCAPTASTGEKARSGSCDGIKGEDPDAPDYRGGKWFVTLNGQVYPTVRVKAPGGEIWRLTNESGSATYDLQLWNPDQKRNMRFQVLSLDGVSVNLTPGMTNKQKREIGGGKFEPESCAATSSNSAGHVSDSICTRTLHMMPSSRAEVWVAYRDEHDSLSTPPKGANAVFRTKGYQTGPSGDYWPAVDLARVEFSGTVTHSLPSALEVNGEATAMLAPIALANAMKAENAQVAPDHSCKALPPGHRRRIFYGVPTTMPDAFGLAYEEVDEHGKVVGERATDLEPFNPMKPTVCVPLGPDNTPVTERWELVNVATEDHNFHIHQVKFRVLTKDELDGTILPEKLAGKGVMLDNVPLPHADGVCGNNSPSDISNPIADWRAGLCASRTITVDIPFSIAGDFVYHCHILEHEDGGMMARIRVRPNH